MKDGYWFLVIIAFIVGITYLIVTENEKILIKQNEETISAATAYFKQKKSQVTIFEAEQHFNKVARIKGPTDRLTLKMEAAIEKLYDSESHANEEEARLNALDDSESVFEEIIESDGQ